ncbi:MAG: O-antigen ligase family protein [bacterium]|nr:O-antigen ligase family protein [Betaproteobacteria bacterium]
MNEWNGRNDMAALAGVPGQAPGWPGRIDDLGRHAVVGLAFAAPISTALANVFLALLAACWLAGGQYRRKLRLFVDSPVAFAALLLFGWLALSLAWGDGFGRDQRQFLRKYADLLMVAVFLWFLLDPRHRSRALAGFAAAMLLTLALSYAAAAGLLPPARWLRAMPGNAVVFKLHITHGLLMALATLLFGLYAFEASAARRRWLAAAWAIACLLALVNVLFMVQGRTGYLVLAAFVVLVFGLRAGWRGLAVASVVVCVGAVAIYQASGSMRQRVDLTLSELRSWDFATPTTESNSIGRRLEFFSNTLAMVRERPLAGHGLGGFAEAYRAQVEGTGKAPTHNPHNEFLLLMAQAGLPAVLLYLHLLARTALTARRLPTLRERVLAPALVLWIGVGGVFNALLIDHTESLLFSLLLGVLAAGALATAPPAAAAGRAPAA